MRIIYDFGANNGDDIPYYLSRADRIVAVEADPQLCAVMRRRFQPEIAAERVFVMNYALSVDGSAEVPFYLHKTQHVGNQLPQPADQDLHNYRRVILPAVLPRSIVWGHGEPYYIKIDLEHYDQEVLRHLFANDIVPPFISAESHSLEVFCLLVGLGRYRGFKLVEGAGVANMRAVTPGGTYRFPPHSAGPFGEDIPGPWISAEQMMMRLCLAGLGWRDIHATSQT